MPARHFTRPYPAMLLKNKKVLITYGPTWEAIDSVRVISNVSTGEMGHRIAAALVKEGAKVTALQGPTTYLAEKPTWRVRSYCYFSELRDLLDAELANGYDIVIHAAAVSDYRPRRSARQKIDSRQDTLHLELVRNPKLIHGIKRKSPDCILVGFKLDPKLTEANVIRKVQVLFSTAQCDVVLANRVSDGYAAYIVTADHTCRSTHASKSAAVRGLIKTLKDLVR